MAEHDSGEQKQDQAVDPRAAAKMRAFLQGDVTLADLYSLTHEELYQLCEQGKVFYENGKLTQARSIFEGLTALDPYDSNFHAGLGAVCQQAGELDRALIEYERAIMLNNLDIASRANRAEILIQKEEYVTAGEELQRVAELDPTGEHPHARRAHALAAALAGMAERALQGNQGGA